MKLSGNEKFKSILFGILLIVVVEILFRLSGVAKPEVMEDPFVGFHGINPLFTKSGKLWVTSENKRKLFNYQEFPIEKEKGHIRIFCFGGSSTFGHPFDWRTGFPRWLQEGLNKADPSRIYEVINLGGISYGSHRIVKLVEEVLEYDPDVFIFYMGHNEFLEDVTYEQIKNRPAYLVATQKIFNSFRIYSLLRKVILPVKEKQNNKKTILDNEVKAILDVRNGLAKFNVTSNVQLAKAEHLKFNINKINLIAQARGVKTIFSSLPSNIRNFAPFKSLNRVDLEKSDQWSKYFNDGKLYFGKNKFAAAFESFEKAEKLDPGYAELAFLMGKSIDRGGLNQDSVSYYKKARDYDRAPLRATTVINKTIEESSLKSGGLFIDIEQIFEDHENINNLFLDHCHPTIEGYQMIANQFLGVLGEIYKFRNPLGLDEVYRRVMEGMDKSFFSLGMMNVGRTLNWAEQFEQAGDVLKKASVQYPENSEIFYLLGNSYKNLGKYQEALENFLIANKLDPENHFVKAELGALYARLGRMEDSLENIKKSEDGVRKSFSLGYLYGKKGALEEAKNEYEKALELNPNMVDSRINLGNVLMKMGDLPGALTEYKKALELEKDNLDIYYNMGVVYQDMGRMDESINAYKKVLKFDQAHKKTLFNLGGVYFQIKNYSESLEYFERFRPLEPDNPDVYNIIGIIKNNQKKYDDAISWFSKSLKRKPDYTDAMNNMALAYFFKEDYDKATFYYQKTLKLDPVHPQAKRGLQISLKKLKK